MTFEQLDILTKVLTLFDDIVKNWRPFSRLPTADPSSAFHFWMTSVCWTLEMRGPRATQYMARTKAYLLIVLSLERTFYCYRRRMMIFWTRLKLFCIYKFLEPPPHMPLYTCDIATVWESAGAFFRATTVSFHAATRIAWRRTWLHAFQMTVSVFEPVPMR